MRFDPQGRVVDFGIAADELERLVASGKPFRTSGCPGRDDDEVSACNRPYGDSSPTDILSFPFAPAPRDVVIVRQQLAGEDVRAGEIAEE
jgi:biotin synthase